MSKPSKPPAGHDKLRGSPGVHARPGSPYLSPCGSEGRPGHKDHLLIGEALLISAHSTRPNVIYFDTVPGPRTAIVKEANPLVEPHPTWSTQQAVPFTQYTLMYQITA